MELKTTLIKIVGRIRSLDVKAEASAQMGKPVVFSSRVNGSNHNYNIMHNNNRETKQPETLWHNLSHGSNETKPALPRLGFSRRDASTMLGISIEALDSLARRGLIVPNRALRCPLYSVKELQRFIDGGAK